MPTLKQQLGCWCHERWRTELVLRFPRLARRLGWHWVDLCNRHERLSREDERPGRICHWQFGSQLTVARFFPRVGGRLLQHSLEQWPVRFTESPTVGRSLCEQNAAVPDASVVIPVRGTGRLPQFRATLGSLLAQEDCGIEVVVVEQSERREFEHQLPECVRYIHTPLPRPDMPFNRSWALNVGARAARGESLLLHDGDMLVPTRFVASIVATLRSGFDALRLARFIFYLDEPTSQAVQDRRTMDLVRSVDWIVQNNPTPIAVTREAYLRIGGHDEAFYGWGSEDNEFLERVQTLRLAGGAYLPVCHLWHAAAPNRSGDRNAGLLARRQAIPCSQRIVELAARPFGQTRPSVAWEPAGP